MSLLATAGDATAQFNLAVRYADGEGVQRPGAMPRTGMLARPTKDTCRRNGNWLVAWKTVRVWHREGKLDWSDIQKREALRKCPTMRELLVICARTLGVARCSRGVGASIVGGRKARYIGVASAALSIIPRLAPRPSTRANCSRCCR